MKKSIIYTYCALFVLVLLSFGSVSCSNNFNEVPQTGFVTNHVENKSSKIPFDSYWNVGDDEKIWNDRVNGVNGQKLMLAIAPIDTEHMDVRPTTPEGATGLSNLSAYFYTALKDRMEKEVKKNPHFNMVPHGTKGAYTLEVAITSITPTAIGKGILVTGLSFVQGGGLVKRLIKKGHIAMAGRLKDENGRVVSEFADYEDDHDSILGIDVKNFTKYGHHKHTIDEWAREITEVYSTVYGTKTRKSMWTLNPF